MAEEYEKGVNELSNKHLYEFRVFKSRLVINVNTNIISSLKSTGTFINRGGNAVLGKLGGV